MNFYVEAPVATPSKFGLLSVADVVDTNNGPWVNDGIEWENESCGDIHFAIACGAEADKEITDSSPISQYDPITVYSLYSCRGPADFQRGAAHAMAALAAGEGKGLEGAVWTQMMAEATDITPTTIPDPELGLALLEKALGNQVNGTPVIHGDRAISSILSGKLFPQGSHLETRLGTLWSAGSGYDNTGPDADPAPTDGYWLIGTGLVRVHRGPSDVLGPYFFTADADRDNTYVALAERSFAAGWLCATLAIQVTDDAGGVDGGGA